MGSSDRGSLGGCQECEMPFERVWVSGWREGLLAKMVADYKYKAVRAMTKSLVEILDATLPSDAILEKAGVREMMVVPLPTIGRHVRERGLDHTDKLARGLAKRREWEYRRVLTRAVDTVQVGTKAAQRQVQAVRAYEVAGVCEAEKCYLLLDDVWTTGASMMAAAQALKVAGAKRVFGVVLATGKPKPQQSAVEG